MLCIRQDAPSELRKRAANRADKRTKKWHFPIFFDLLRGMSPTQYAQYVGCPALINHILLWLHRTVNFSILRFKAKITFFLQGPDANLKKGIKHGIKCRLQESRAIPPLIAAGIFFHTSTLPEDY